MCVEPVQHGLHQPVANAFASPCRCQPGVDKVGRRAVFGHQQHADILALGMHEAPRRVDRRAA